MNFKIILFALSAAAISSCSSTYRSSQTPDDIYYSPARGAEETYIQEKTTTIAPRRTYMDRQIVMGIYDPRWRYFEDDYDAYYNPYKYGYSCGYYYNPYYYPSPVYISGAVFTNPKNSTPRMTNLGSYNYSNMVVVNSKEGATKMIRSTRAYNNSNSGNQYIRRISTPVRNNPSYNNSYQPSDNNTRTYTPSTNNSSSNSSSSGTNTSSGAPVSRPARGH